MSNIFDQDPQGPPAQVQPAVAAPAQPQTLGNGAANPPAQTPAAAPQTRRGLGCVPGAIRTLLALTVVVILTIGVLGTVGYRIPLIHEVAKGIGYSVILALGNSTARFGYAVIVLPTILIVATWIASTRKGS